MKTVRNVTYFETFPKARAYAQEHGLNTDRINYFLKGWAIQRCVSGAYWNAKTGRWE